VTLATYMFDASPFSAYLKNEGFTFNRQTVNGNLTAGLPRGVIQFQC